ncbi:MAG TPA: AMP-binding protein [Planctomycetota bacterium]|nr:AMP-binding protein [Planctomycetota bacterium]
MDIAHVIKNNRLLFDAIRRPVLVYGSLKRRLAALEAAPLAQREAFHRRRLDRVLAAASRMKYGRDRAPEGRDAKRLEAWPILTKAQVRSDQASFINGRSWPGSRGQTSGTTGSPMAVHRSLPSLAVEQVAWDMVVEKHGVDPRTMRTAVMRGDLVKSFDDHEAPFGRVSQGGRWLVMSSNHLAASTVRAFVEELRAFAPHCIYAYPSSLHALCALMELHGLRLDVPLALTSSEVLDESTLRLARRVLGCTVADYYGQAERVAFAAAHDGAGYRFMPGYAHVELEPAGEKEDGDCYEIIGTTLWNLRMPLVRYRTGDFIVAPAGLDAAALDELRFGLRPFLRLLGRQGEFIAAPDGTHIVGLSRLLYDVEHVYRFQVVQESSSDLLLLLMPMAGFTDRDRERVVANAQARIPKSMRVRVELTDRLERTPAGKTPFVIVRTPAA